MTSCTVLGASPVPASTITAPIAILPGVPPRKRQKATTSAGISTQLTRKPITPPPGMVRVWAGSKALRNADQPSGTMIASNNKVSMQVATKRMKKPT